MRSRTGASRRLSPAGRAGLDRRAAGAASRRAHLHLLEIFPERVRPRRRIAHRSPAAEPVPCRPPGRRRRRPRCAGPRTVERSCAGLDRTCGRKHKVATAGSAPDETSISRTLASLRNRESHGIQIVKRSDDRQGFVVLPRAQAQLGAGAPRGRGKPRARDKVLSAAFLLWRSEPCKIPTRSGA
jgi:hypothetical protein